MRNRTALLVALLLLPAAAEALTPGTRPLDSAPRVLVSELADERVGTSIAVPGDLAGDGVPDVVIGAPGANDGAGRVYVISGAVIAAQRFVQLRDEALVLEGAPGSAFGAMVESAGDVDGDGWPDFLVAAPGFFESQADTPEGRLYLFPGGPEAMAAVDHRDDAVMRLTGPHPGAALGTATAAAGDANGDGLDDFAVLIRDPNTLAGTGQVAVIAGRAQTAWGLAPRLPDVAAWSWRVDGLGAPSAGVPLARTIANAGDVDGDGYDDLLIGMPLKDTGFLDAGGVFLVPGMAESTDDLLEPDPEFDGLAELEGDELDLQLGVTLSRGRQSDLAWVGAAGLGSAGAGRAYQLGGAPPYLVAAPVTEIRAPGPGAVDVLAADLEGDGSAGPLLVQPSASGEGIGADDAGLLAAYAVAVGGELTLNAADAIFLGEGGWEAGRDVEVANLDGDGYDDVLVGAPGALQTGAVFALLGADLTDGDGFSPLDGDCDDTVASVHPAAEEICDDGRDNDCNGFVDGLDAPCGLEGSGVLVSCSAAGSPAGAGWLALALIGLGVGLRRRGALVVGVGLALALGGCPSPSPDGEPGIRIVAPADGDRIIGLLLPVEVEVTGGRLAAEREGLPPLDETTREFLWELSIDGVPRPLSGGPLQVVDELSPGVHSVDVALFEAEAPDLENPLAEVTGEVRVDLVATAPTVEITAPDTGSFVSPDGFELRLDVRGFTFDGGAVGLANQPGVGHAHVLLDDDPEDADPPFVVDEIAAREVLTGGFGLEGDYELSVMLVNNDHSPLEPEATDAIDVSIRAPQLIVLAPTPGSTVTTAPEVQVEYSVLGFVLDPDDVNSPSGDVPPGVGHVHIYLGGAYQGLDASGAFTLPAANGCDQTLTMVLALANHEEQVGTITEVPFSLEPCVAVEPAVQDGSDVSINFTTPGFTFDGLGTDGQPDGRHAHFSLDGVFENVTVANTIELDGVSLGEHEVLIELFDGDHGVDEAELLVSGTVTFEVLP